MASDARAVVALVSSTGGMAATSAVLGRLPVDLPAAVITLQHMSPDGESRLPQIYAGQTALPVLACRDGEPLEPGRVYVAPPGFHTLVTPVGRLTLVRSGGFPPARPSADLLLVSLALALGRAVTAVVLTGVGSDGATGAATVRKHGGVVLASDEATSTEFAMPSATIARGDTDAEVLALGDLPTRIVQLARLAAQYPPR